MGPKVKARMVRPGFYPAGGGQVECEITPAARLRPLELLERGAVTARLASAQVANLDMDIAKRELAVVAKKLSWAGDELRAVKVRDGVGPGNLLTLRIECEHVTEVFAGFGQVHKRAEQVAKDAVNEARQYLAAGVPVGPHLADQLLLPLAMAGGGSFRTVAPTLHTRTNIEVIERFLPVRFVVEPEEHFVRVTVGAR
jgi:RNA 3'-terminal phosphate cyclase (ATP)